MEWMKSAETLVVVFQQIHCKILETCKEEVGLIIFVGSTCNRPCHQILFWEIIYVFVTLRISKLNLSKRFLELSLKDAN